MLIKFVTTLAWIFGVLSTTLVVLRIIGYFRYTELERLRDQLRGQVTSFPITRPATIAIICWAWAFIDKITVR